MTISLPGPKREQHFADICTCLLEKNVPDKIMLRIWNAILISLYLNYEITEDFQAQFQQNSDAILSLIETLRTVDVLMSNKN